MKNGLIALVSFALAAAILVAWGIYSYSGTSSAKKGASSSPVSDYTIRQIIDRNVEQQEKYGSPHV